MKYSPGDILKWNDNTRDTRFFMIVESYTYTVDPHERYKIRMLNDLDFDTNFSHDLIHKNCSLVQKGRMGKSE